jgi:hypothetical protein
MVLNKAGKEPGIGKIQSMGFKKQKTMLARKK